MTDIQMLELPKSNLARIIYDGRLSALACEEDFNHISNAILSRLDVRFDLTLILSGRVSEWGSYDSEDVGVEVGRIFCEIENDEAFNQPRDWSTLGPDWTRIAIQGTDREDATLGCMKADEKAWIKFESALGPRESDLASTTTQSDVSDYREFVVGFKKDAIHLNRQQIYHELTTYDHQGKKGNVGCKSIPTFHLYGVNATELWVWLHVFKPYQEVTSDLGVWNHPPQLKVGSFIKYWITFYETLQTPIHYTAPSYTPILAAEGPGTVSMKAPLLQGLAVGSYVLILLGGATLTFYGELEEGRGVYKALGGPITAILLLAWTIVLKKLFPLWELADALSFKLKIDSISSLPPNRATILQSVLPKKPYHAWLCCLIELMDRGHILASGPYACWSPKKSAIGGFKLDRRVRLLSLAAAGIRFTYHLSFVFRDGGVQGYFIILKANYTSYDYTDREIGRVMDARNKIHLDESSDRQPERPWLTECNTYRMVRQRTQRRDLLWFIPSRLDDRLSLLHEAIVGGASDDQRHPLFESAGKAAR